jgi:hypothetical protein
MIFFGKALCALATAALCLAAQAAPTANPPATTTLAAATADARYVVQWVQGTRDNDGMPYAVVDKKAARLYVFDAAHRLVGSSTVLLGAAVGDESAPGIGAKDPKDMLPHELTTPAGRFVSEPGRNLDGEAVVWVDYDAGFAIHRVRPGASLPGRLRKLDSAGTADNRTSLGCVVVPQAFYESVVSRVLGQRRGVVYVMPETRPVRTVFGAEAAAEAM